MIIKGCWQALSISYIRLITRNSLEIKHTYLHSLMLLYNNSQSTHSISAREVTSGSAIFCKYNVSKSYMLICETSSVSGLYVTAKFSRKSHFSAKVTSSIDITSPNIFVSTASSIFKDNSSSSRSTTIFAVTLFSHVVAVVYLV